MRPKRSVVIVLLFVIFTSIHLSAVYAESGRHADTAGFTRPDSLPVVPQEDSHLFSYSNSAASIPDAESSPPAPEAASNPTNTDPIEGQERLWEEMADAPYEPGPDDPAIEAFSPVEPNEVTHQDAINGEEAEPAGEYFERDSTFEPMNPPKDWKNALEEKKAQLNRRYCTLAEERRRLEEYRRTVGSRSEIESYNRQVQQFNQDVQQYRHQRQMLAVEVQAFNASIAP